MSARIIFKHPFVENVNVLTLTRDAVVLAVQEQDGRLCLWEQHAVAAENEVVERTFVIIGTGHTFDPRGLTWIATVQVSRGVFVWHVYERGTPADSGGTT